MNDDDLDRIAQRAAAHTRAEARAITDSETALRRLLDSATADAAPMATVVLGAVTGTGGRSTARTMMVAAAIVVLVAGFGYALLRGSGGFELATPTGTGSGPGLPTATATPPPRTAPDASSGTSPTGSTTLDPSVPDSTAPDSTAPDPTAPPAVPPFTWFEVPEVKRPTLEEVPRLLPADPPPAERTYLSEWDADEDAPQQLSQLWVRSGPDGTVDAVFHLGTRIAPTYEQPGGEAIDVPGWSSGRLRATVDGVVIAELSAPQGVVELWASGLSRSEALAIAGELVADGPGWRSPTLAGDGWTAVDATWARGYAVRSLTTLDAEGDIDRSIDISRGLSVFDGGGVIQLDTELQLVDVAGQPGLLRRDGISALVVARSDGVMVRYGSRDPAADLVGVASSAAPVDQAAWGSASRPWPDGADGCLSLFC